MVYPRDAHSIIGKDVRKFRGGGRAIGVTFLRPLERKGHFTYNTKCYGIMKRGNMNRHHLSQRYRISLDHRIFLFLFDLIAISVSYIAALLLRFDLRFSAINKLYLKAWVQFLPIYAIFCILIFVFCRLYSSVWRYASFIELARILVASVITSVFHTVFITFLFARMPISYYLTGGLLQFLLICGIRFLYRFMVLLDQRRKKITLPNPKNVLVIGAGYAGRSIIRGIQRNPDSIDLVRCVIDDDRGKWRHTIDGIPIVGGRDEILAAVEKYEINRIYLAIFSLTTGDRRDILNICQETDCEVKQLVSYDQLFDGDITVDNLKNISVEDLLGRDPIKADLSEVFDFIQGKVVLVTGGGGSIGSELCRQIAGHRPKQLIIFDVYENNAYDIQLELKDKYPDLDLLALIGSVRDTFRMLDIFRRYQPDIVYHAAAHKHVPLMEDSPCEAIKNNVLGTYKTALAAMLFGTEKFVLISTDKAVNPTNIMGASKRLCEMVVQTFDRMIREGKQERMLDLVEYRIGAELKAMLCEQARAARTDFVAVRFGNVLGSNGSVVPIFKRQIAQGGPVTVTHPDIIRYFMTIPEAVSLVLQAGTYARGGEIFVLDMGSPVKIDQLARNLIRLAGYRPNKDIRIEYTGLRPGEKLYEEKLMEEEGMRKTANNLIYIGSPIAFEPLQFLADIKRLQILSMQNADDMVAAVESIVPTFHPEKIS